MNDQIRARLAADGAAVNAGLRAAAVCFCRCGRCARPEPGVQARAVYVWHTAIGNEVPLCPPCCAVWRADAEAGRCEQPVKIEEL